jgi:hypothetical protein
MKIKHTYKQTFVYLSFILLYSCNSTKEIDNTKHSNSENKTDKVFNNEETIYPLYISFYSIGEGINMDVLQKFESFLSEFLQKNKLKSIGAEKINWGREGEIDYCISFSDINKLTYTDFINQTKTLLSNKQHVIIKEKAACVHKR